MSGPPQICAVLEATSQLLARELSFHQGQVARSLLSPPSHAVPLHPLPDKLFFNHFSFHSLLIFNLLLPESTLCQGPENFARSFVTICPSAH